MSDTAFNLTESIQDAKSESGTIVADKPPPFKKPKTESLTTTTTITTTTEESGFVTVLDRGPNHVVVFKPHSVICHHSSWSGSKSRNNRKGDKKREQQQQQGGGDQPEAPMLQRVREVVGQRVNLIHRLDRGASGCLLFSLAPTSTTTTSATKPSSEEQMEQNNANDEAIPGDADQRETNASTKSKTKDDLITSQLIEAHRMGQKTYLALVRGEGILHGQDFKQQGWFSIDRPIKDEKGNMHDALTWFRFVAGQASPLNNNNTSNATDPNSNEATDNSTDASSSALPRARASLVLARPHTGRWHQIRKHLNGLSHPILGDGTHGNGPVNREWKEKRGLLPERICLHLLRMEIPANEATSAVLPNGLNVTCPLPMDMWNLLEQQLPDVLQQARTILEQEEGIILQPLREDGSHDQFEQVPYHVIQTYTTKQQR